MKGLEIKLTAIPDHSTCDFHENEFGSEIVIGPDTIVYLACSIVSLYKNDIEKLKKLIDKNLYKITDWSNANTLIPHTKQILKTIDLICLQNIDKQEPIIMQPIWKTEGKTSKLSNNCLDVFIWSNLAFIKLFTEEIRKEKDVVRTTRQTRTLIWLFKMLFDFSNEGQFNHKSIIDELSYNTKNDKAFAVSGSITQLLMKCEELISPRITKENIKKIILGGGQNLLSPERRFDSILCNSPDLFG